MVTHRNWPFFTLFRALKSEGMTRWSREGACCRNFSGVATGVPNWTGAVRGPEPLCSPAITFSDGGFLRLLGRFSKLIVSGAKASNFNRIYFLFLVHQTTNALPEGHLSCFFLHSQLASTPSRFPSSPESWQLWLQRPWTNSVPVADRRSECTRKK